MADASNPSGTSNLYRIAPLRGTENYNVWRIQMEDILTDLDLYEFVNRANPCPESQIEVELSGQQDEDGKALPDSKEMQDNPEYPKWCKTDRKALLNIRLRVDGHVLTHIQGCTTSADAWDLLASTFQVQGTMGLIGLRRKFFSHRMTDGEDLEEHIRRMRDWFQQINDIDPGSCTEIDFITTLVSSLPETWDSFTQSIDFSFDRKDTNKQANQISDLRARIMAEAHRRSTKNDNNSALFSTTKPGYNKFMKGNTAPRQAGRSPDKSNSTCKNCGNIGHWAAECRQPGGGAYKQNHRNHPNKSRNPNKKFYNHGKQKNRDPRAHIAVETPKKDEDFSFSAFDDEIALLSTSKCTWIADSGSTIHVANNRSLFTEYKSVQGTVTGVTGKDSIIGKGTVILRSAINEAGTQFRTITLRDVAHVPTCPANLISLSKVTDSGFRIEMEGHQMRVLSKDGTPIALGKKAIDRPKGSLWHMKCQTFPESKPSESENTIKRAEIALYKQTGRTWYEWHKILGHIGPQALQRLKNTNAVSGMEIIESSEGLDFECEACIQAKAHTRPFPKESKTEVKEIGELVVTDVWGPAKTNSIGRYRYYVSFTDVATRYTRLGFLRHKDETLNEYKAFEAILNTQMDKKIKKVRFDNGGEFVNKEWQEHTRKNGTILETTAPYSAQQNGIAERLNRTLTEKARALLIEANAPIFLWSEAIAYACYLKNRVTTQVHGKFQPTPYEAFWGKKPDVSTLRPWGTKCYVLNQSEGRSKLDPKTFTAIFTGISDVQGKSWRYYKKGVPKILHSRNITFPRGDALQGDELNEINLEDSVAPPAEGEKMTQEDSKAKRQVESDGTGGVKSEPKTEKQEELKTIKAEGREQLKTTHSTTPPAKLKSESAPLVSPTSSRSKSNMPKQPRSSTLKSMKAINSLHTNTHTGIQTRRSNPNAPAISLEKERGGVTIKIEGDAHPPTDSEHVNYCSDLSSNYEDLYGDLPDLVPSYGCDSSSSDSSLPEGMLYYPPDKEQDGFVMVPPPKIISPPPTPVEPPNPVHTPSEYNGIDQDYDMIDDEPNWAFAARVSAVSDNPTVDEALQSYENPQWRAAMDEEYNNLVRLGVFEEVPRPSPPTNVIGCRWVLARKRNELGEITRYKARLVAKGYTQKPGQDFDDTFAPVLRLESFRILCALANFYDWDMRQLDVVSAYLHADLEEELYMEQIPYYTDGTNGVLRLRRSLYGLKQSGRAWNRTLDRKLRDLGYLALRSDSCIYYRMRMELGIMQTSIIAIHVDDSVVITSPEHTDEVVRELTREFEMRDLGPLRHFLGIQIERHRAQRILVLKQTTYIDAIIELAGLVNAYPADTPLSPTTILTRHEGRRPDYPYATMIGKLMYAALCTRPDIAFAVTHLAQFNSCFGPAHITAIKRVLRYLKGTSFMGLTYRRKDDIFGEVGYSDSDWASSMLDRKSVSGNVFMLGGAAVTWLAKKQATVALSTMEAEYMAIVSASTQALWVRQFFEELDFPSSDPTLIVSDNLAALTLTVESQFHARSKHIDIRYHFVRDAINKSLISTMYVRSEENLADALTKALPAPRFNYLMNTIMGEQIFGSEDDYLWN